MTHGKDIESNRVNDFRFDFECGVGGSGRPPSHRPLARRPAAAALPAGGEPPYPLSRHAVAGGASFCPSPPRHARHCPGPAAADHKQNAGKHEAAAAAARDRQQVDNAARVVASAGISVRIPAVMVRFPSTRNWRQPRRPGKPTRSSQRMPRACMMASSSGKLFSFLAADAGRRHTRQRPGRRAFTRKRRPSSAHCVRTGEEAQSLHPRARKKRHSARRAAHRGRWRRTPRSASGERSRGPTWASSPEGARVKPGLSSNRLGRGLPSPRPRHPRALARAPGAPSRCAARRRSAPGGRGTPS